MKLSVAIYNSNKLNRYLKASKHNRVLCIKFYGRVWQRCGLWLSEKVWKAKRITRYIAFKRES